MGLPSNEVAIANLALDRLGQPHVSNISPGNTSTEIILAGQFGEVRQSLLRKHIFPFAVKRVNISRVADAPAMDFPDAYQLPADFVRLLSVMGEFGEISQSRDYAIEGRTVLIDGGGAGTIKCRYIADVTDVSQWDAGFRRCFAIALAIACCYKITKKTELLKPLESELARELPDAVTVAGQEVPPRRIQRSKYLDARAKGAGSVNIASKYVEFD